MIYVGIDVHKTRSTLVALDPSTGEYCECTVLTQRDELVAALLKVPEPFVVGVEATLFAPAVTAWLREAQITVVQLDPQALATYAKGRRAKNDRIDALLMAKAMAEGCDVECYLAEEEVLQLRAVTRGREVLVKISSMLRNTLRSVLFQRGTVVELSDLRGATAMELVPQLIDALQGNVAMVAAAFWTLLGEVEQTLGSVDARIKEEVKHHPVASVVEKLPGLGPITALTVVAEIGRIDRFPSPKHLHSYAGVVPTTHESANTKMPGHLPAACNKRLRWAAVMAAQGAARRTAPNKAKSAYKQVRYRCGPNSAKIAAARKILLDIYFLWRQVVE